MTNLRTQAANVMRSASSMLVGALEPAPQVDLAELAFGEFSAAAEIAAQHEVVRMRKYYAGDQISFLTPRMRQYLDVTGSGVNFRFNICHVVIAAITEIMIVEGFEAPDAPMITPEPDMADMAGEAGEAGGLPEAPQAPAAAPMPQSTLPDTSLSDWAYTVWQRNHMDDKQDDVHTDCLRDRESFVIVDWEPDEGRPRFTPHQRYTDAQEANGDGEGCKCTYVNDDDNQPMLFASKRWTETVKTRDGKNDTRQRLTLYFPDRIEKYMHGGRDWVAYRQPGEPWPLPWLDEFNEPLGIPVVHFRNKGMRSELWDAISLQDALNKALLDLLASTDAAGFRILFATGFIPTKDGKDMAQDASNAMDIGPGQTIATMNPNGKLAAIPAESPTPLLDVIQGLILYLAVVSDTPVQRFQFGKAVARAETLREQNATLHAKVRKRETRLGDAWEKCFDIARRLTNLALARKHTVGLDICEPFDLSQDLEVKWMPLDLMDIADKVAEATGKAASNVPDEQIWRDVWGYDDAQIANMLKMRAAAAPPPTPAAPAVGAVAGMPPGHPLAAMSAKVDQHLQKLNDALAAGNPPTPAGAAADVKLPPGDRPGKIHA